MGWFFDWEGETKREYDGETDNNGYFSLTVAESSYGVEFHLPPISMELSQFQYQVLVLILRILRERFWHHKSGKTTKTISGTAKKSDGSAITSGHAHAWRVDGNGWADAKIGLMELHIRCECW